MVDAHAPGHPQLSDPLRQQRPMADRHPSGTETVDPWSTSGASPVMARGVHLPALRQPGVELVGIGSPRVGAQPAGDRACVRALLRVRPGSACSSADQTSGVRARRAKPPLGCGRGIGQHERCVRSPVGSSECRICLPASPPQRIPSNARTTVNLPASPTEVRILPAHASAVQRHVVLGVWPCPYGAHRSGSAGRAAGHLQLVRARPGTVGRGQTARVADLGHRGSRAAHRRGDPTL
jgi:hypothetical protein